MKCLGKSQVSDSNGLNVMHIPFFLIPIVYVVLQMLSNAMLQFSTVPYHIGYITIISIIKNKDKPV